MKLPDVQVKNILYATDLSENAFHAFAYAVSLAGLYGAKLTLLHVLEEAADLDERVIGYISEERWNAIKERNYDEARQALIGKRRDSGAVEEALNAFCERAAEGCSDKTFFQAEPPVVRRGNPVEEIVKEAEVGQADLIVMGTHGLGTLADAMMGSTARRVLRRASIPVLVVRLP
jgi:nucleotide-binding universal stress UspA family protein